MEKNLIKGVSYSQNTDHLLNMWLDLWKPGFHKHPISWLWEIITYSSNALEGLNFKT